MPKGPEPVGPTALAGILDFNSFREFLRSELGWPVPTDVNLNVEDLSYAYLADQLQLKPEQAARLKVRQLIPFHQNQPWGIFLLEFNSQKFYRRSVRQVMRALGPRRQRDAQLPQWRHENLLFVCTNDYRQFTFGHFSGEKATAARLTTFTLDPDSLKNRTLREYNLPELRWPTEDGVAPEPEVWLKQWKRAFDKEALTNRFFKIFRALFVKVAADICKNNSDISSDDANTEAQIILERVLFLYFLQRKGWLDQQPGYLYQRFREIDGKNPGGTNYYSNFLSRVFQQLSSHQELYSESIGRLPFLNGGLFEDDPVVYSDGMQRRLRLKVSNAVFGEIFDGMLERFNFTVREDTPLNQDVAVDPEMLGKILESLVLEMEEAGDAYAPDRRKATGSYYTPRIVVHFICREVLRQYLLARVKGVNWAERLERLLNLDATDGLDKSEFDTLRDILSQHEAEHIRTLLVDLKTCDPAVGSGAFPVGLLHELVNLWTLCEAREREKDPTQDRNYFFGVKKRFIENSIYGVDVLERAVEICKLRLWLSLIVDYEVRVDPFECTREQFAAALKELPPLPNLAFKIRRGDALLDQVRGHDLILEEFVRREGRGSRQGQDLVDGIVRLKAEYFSENGIEEKRRLQVRVLERQWELAQRFVKQQIEDLPAIQVQGFFGETEKDAEKRHWREQQEKRLQQALHEIAELRKELDIIESRKTISDVQARKLAELEGQVGARLSFVWHLDFAEVFNRTPQGVATPRGELPRANKVAGQTRMTDEEPMAAGFDIIVGNPPFVTARDPERREAYRRRWPRVCYQKYHLLAPFFERSFGILTSTGELGFIVSNAFAKREFGKPLVEDFFSTVNLRKVVDCSGLMFPGHGTPTCIVFGSQEKVDPETTIRNIVTLPGGGDLRTPPEESPLWHSIEAHHSLGSSHGECAPLSLIEAQQGFRKVHEDFRIAVGDCDRGRILKHPCVWGFFDWPAYHHIESSTHERLTGLIEGDVGVCTMTNCDEVFPLLPDQARRLNIEAERLFPFQEGESIRNWSLDADWWVLNPYDPSCKPIPEKKLGPNTLKFLELFKDPLANRLSFGNKTFEQLGRPWYSFERMNANKYATPDFLAFVEIATHAHFCYSTGQRLYKQTTQTVKLPRSSQSIDFHVLASVLNSSGALFWLKQVCFNKGAGEDEERDRFVYAGNKVQQLPVPTKVAETLKGKSNGLAERLTQLSQACWERGQRMPALALRKLFEKPGEGYHGWNSQLSGYVTPDAGLGPPFDSSAVLRRAYDKARAMRDHLRAEMIALQEEMDWLVYAAYGLLPEEHPAVQAEAEPDPLERQQRPFVIWADAQGNYDDAVKLIPAGWPAARKKLWEARLAAIRDNEHIRRIEQPVYKRRWDEQWKVGNQWRCGPIAYAAEFLDAFEWWLREKAEWWLEHKKNGGAAEFEEWAQALWKDARVQAAWPVAAEEYARLAYEKAREKAEANGEPVPSPAPPAADFACFKQKFREIADKETVPEGFPFGTPYDELEKKLKRPIPGKLRKVRGELNVPRERFHLRGKSQYLWAGLQFRD